MASSVAGLMCGSAPGILWLWAGGNTAQSVAFAALGGLIGVGIFGGAAIYDVPVSESLSRVVRGCARMVLEKNLHAGDLVPMDDVREVVARLERKVDPRLFARLRSRATVGCGAGILFGILVTPWIPPDQDSNPVTEFVGPTFLTILTALLGSLYLGAAAMLTVPGRHRLTIPVGLTVGLAIGALIATMSAAGAVHPQAFCMFMVGLFGTLGLAAGCFTPEALGLASTQGDADPHDW